MPPSLGWREGVSKSYAFGYAFMGIWRFHISTQASWDENSVRDYIYGTTDSLLEAATFVSSKMYNHDYTVVGG